MSMDTKGGRVTIDIDGVRYSVRAKAKIMPSRVTMKSGANQDGTGYSTIDPKLAGLDLTFDRGPGFNWDETMMLKTMNVTFVETDISPRKTHLFTNARFDGEPEINTEDGEVTGLKIMSDQYAIA